MYCREILVTLKVKPNHALTISCLVCLSVGYLVNHFPVLLLGSPRQYLTRPIGLFAYFLSRLNKNNIGNYPADKYNILFDIS